MITREEVVTAKSSCGVEDDKMPVVTTFESLSPSMNRPVKTPIDPRISACEYRRARDPTDVPRHVEKLFAPRITHKPSVGNILKNSYNPSNLSPEDRWA